MMSSISQFAQNKPTIKVGVLYGTSSGSDSKDAIRGYASTHSNIQLVTEQVLPTTEQNVVPYVLNAKAAAPDLMVLVATSTQDLLFIKTSAEQGFKPSFVGYDGTMAAATLTTLAAAQGAYKVATTHVSGPGSDAFNKAVRAIGTEPSDQGREEYGITKTFIEILKRCGDDLSWAHFESVAESMKNFDTGIFSPLTFGPLPNGHRSGFQAMLLQIKDQQWAEVTGQWISPPSDTNSKR
jgi:ABC-type branched-subunit amino acid transport system substrate-binding protein